MTDEQTKAAQLAHIYAEVASGRALIRVLRDDPDMPAPATFWRWHMADDEIRDNLARARENGVEALMDESLSIADDTTHDFVMGENGLALNREHIQRSKLRVETRMKYAQMIAPRKYGPKVDLTSGGKPITANIDDAAARAAAILEAARNRAAQAGIGENDA